MNTIKLTSCLKVISRVQRVFKPNAQDWIADGIEAVGEGLSKMGIPSSYLYLEKDVDILEYRGKTPCCIFKVEKAFYLNSELPIVFATNKVDPENTTENIAIGSPYCSIHDTTIKASFETGTITLHYQGIPVDEEGFPQVPDYDEVIVALSWYVLYILLSGGMKHHTFSIDDAEKNWEKFYPAAQNSLRFDTVAKMEAFADLWTSFPGAGKYVDLEFNKY